jgi:hypothetical protein
VWFDGAYGEELYAPEGPRGFLFTHAEWDAGAVEGTYNLIEALEYRGLGNPFDDWEIRWHKNGDGAPEEETASPSDTVCAGPAPRETSPGVDDEVGDVATGKRGGFLARFRKGPRPPAITGVD